MKKSACQQSQVPISAEDLDESGRLCCPRPDQQLWNAHPIVAFAIGPACPRVTCPYCGTQYYWHEGQED